MHSSRAWRDAALALLVTAWLAAVAGCTPQPGGDPLGVLNDGTPGDGTQNPQTGDGAGTLSSALRVQPEELRFGGTASTLTLFLRSVANEPLVLGLAADADWLQLGAVALVLTPDEETQVVVVIDRAVLTEGSYAATVTLTAADLAPLLVPVTVTAGAATDDDGTPERMQVTPTALSFGRTGRTLSFLVRNRGAGVLEYSATADAAWMTLRDASGTSEGQYETVAVSVARETLGPGTYTGTVTVSGGGETATVAVTMEVAAPSDGGGESLTVSHDALSFGNAQVEGTVLVRYIGDAPTTFSVRSEVSWATPDVTAGTNYGEYDPVRVTVNRAGLPVGDHAGDLVVSLPNGTEKRVRLEAAVTAPGLPGDPVLWVSSDLLELHGDVSETVFLLRNSGGGTLQYSITPVAPDDEWITVSPDAGESSGEEDAITVRIDRSYLINGTFNSQLAVLSSTGQTQTVYLVVTNTLPPPVDPSTPDLVEWPTSDENMSYVVLVQQYAVPGLGPWACCPLAYWGTNAYLGYLQMRIEPQHTEAELSALFEATKAYIRQNIPGAVFSTYISGGDCRKIEDIQNWPYDAVPYEEMPPDSFETPYREDEGRVTVDIANLNTMVLFADKIIAHALPRGAPVLWLDNVRHPGSGGTDAPWPVIASFLGRITGAMHQAGVRVVSNLALIPFALTDGDADMVKYNVDGVCMERPFHPLCRSTTALCELEIMRYRQWMDYGLLVELIPHWFPEGGTREEAHDFLAGMIMILRRPGDPIFLSHAFFVAPPHWAFWPRDFGAALGEYTIIAHDPPVYRREFEHAIITVDVAKTLDGATHGQAVQVQWR